MLTNAQTKINDILTASIITPRTGDGRAADNARNIWNTQFDWRRSVFDASKPDLYKVKGTSSKD